MRLLEWDLIQYYRCPSRKRRKRHSHELKEDHVKTQCEDGPRQAKEKDLRRKHPCRHIVLRLLASRSMRK